MKKTLLKTGWMIALLAIIGFVQAQTDVNLYVFDTTMTLTDVKAKGAFNSWELVTLTKTDGVSTHTWKVTIAGVADGSYEWGAIQDDKSANGIWLPSIAGFGSNPSFTVSGTTITGDTAIYMPAIDPVDVVFSVDFSYQARLGNFDVTTDTAGVSGTLNDWAYTKLTKIPTDSIYEVTVPLAGYVEYKFRMKDQWDPVSNNRAIFVDGSTDPVILETVWYGDISPAPLVDVTFFLIDNTNYYTGIQYKGEITGWSLVDMFDDGATSGDVTAGDHIWTLTLTDVVSNKSYEWGVVDGDENWLISGSNRVVVLDENGVVSGDTSYEIPAWGTVPVTFMVNMNCHINLEVFDIETSCIDVNIDGYPPVELAHVDTGVFAATITRFKVGEELAYTFRINCEFGGDYEEYPGFDNNREFTVVDTTGGVANTTGVLQYQDDVITTGFCNYVDVSSVKDVSNESGIRFYPNPVSDVLTLDNAEGVRKMMIYSITGQKVKEFTGLRDNRIEISTADLPSGLYIITLYGDEGHLGYKKIIKR